MAVSSLYGESAPKVAPNSREARALELYRTRGHLIRALGGDRFEVPSCGMEGKRYIVHYGGLEESCSCQDFEFGGGRACKHLLAVGIHHATRRSGVRAVGIPAAGDGFKAAAKKKRQRATLALKVLAPFDEEEGVI